jgi:hypothetical protein
MDSITIARIRNHLSGNLCGFAASASHWQSFPRQIKPQAVKEAAARCVAHANFAYGIGAIDAHDFGLLRDIVEDCVALNALRLRRVYNNPEVIPGAIAAACSDLGTDVARLRNACRALRNESATDPVLLGI